MDLPFGLKLSRADSTPTSVLGLSDALDVDKAAGIPALARIDAAGTQRLQELAGAAPSQALGSTMPALGVRPNPGALPDATQESVTDLLRFAIPWGGNIGYTPRSGFGTPFSMLRGLASTSPILALCIQCRKDQMAALDWEFTPKDKKQKGLDAKIEKAQAFFEKPDGTTPFKTWLQVLVDEVLTVDAVSIFKTPTVRGAMAALDAAARGDRFQLAAEDIVGYDIIDGTTIKVLLDGRGKLPMPPSIAYRQIIFGQPVRGGDCTTDQLMYRPKTVRTWTPYGMSPIEAALLIVTADLNRTLFNLTYFTEGNIPEAMVGVPDSWTATQAAKWQQYWDILLRGDAMNRSRMKFVPQAMAKTVHEFKKPDFTTAYDLWLLKIQCACFGVTPSEIGFTDDVNKATSKSQGDVNQRRGVKPNANYIKGLIDEMLVDLGLGELEIAWSGGEGEDALSQAKIVDMNIRNGRQSLDEVRIADGNDPVGAGPAIVTPAGVQFWDDIVAASEAAPEPGSPEALAAAQPQAAAVPGTEGEPKPQQVAAAKVALLGELRKWKTVAQRAVKAGEAAPIFTSDIIGPRLRTNVERSLVAAQTVEDVSRIFEQARGRVEKAQKFSKVQVSAEKKMGAALTTTLDGMGKAFATHAAAQIAATEKAITAAAGRAAAVTKRVDTDSAAAIAKSIEAAAVIGKSIEALAAALAATQPPVVHVDAPQITVKLPSGEKRFDYDAEGRLTKITPIEGV